MRRFKRTNTHENVKPKIWFDVTIIKKDDLAYAIDNDDDVVYATKAIVCAKNEDDAIDRALQMSTGHSSRYWESDYILHRITYIGKHNHPEKEYDTYVDVPIEDVNYNPDDLNYYQERENDIYYDYNESVKVHSKTHKSKMNETSLGLRVFKNEKEVYDHISLELDLIIKRIERLYEWLPRHMLKTHAKDVAGILANIVEDTHFKLGDVQVYLDDLKRDPKDRHLCH